MQQARNGSEIRCRNLVHAPGRDRREFLASVFAGLGIACENLHLRRADARPGECPCERLHKPRGAEVPRSGGGQWHFPPFALSLRVDVSTGCALCATCKMAASCRYPVLPIHFEDNFLKQTGRPERQKAACAPRTAGSPATLHQKHSLPSCRYRGAWLSQRSARSRPCAGPPRGVTTPCKHLHFT